MRTSISSYINNMLGISSFPMLLAWKNCIKLTSIVLEVVTRFISSYTYIARFIFLFTNIKRILFRIIVFLVFSKRNFISNSLVPIFISVHRNISGNCNEWCLLRRQDVVVVSSVDLWPSGSATETSMASCMLFEHTTMICIRIGK